jgi:glycosyltransferase involved in cell wall biosynthesis
MEKKILFYYPSSKRSIAMETLLTGFSREGYNVIGLTTCEKGDLHDVLEENGIKTFSFIIPEKPRVFFYLKHIIFLINFCKKHNINYVHSHLQQVNIIAVFAQFFIRAKVIIFRHHFQYLNHSSYSGKRNKNEQVFDYIINKLAKLIVVPSSSVYNYMIKEENVSPNKIKILPYIYDFSKYHNPDPNEVAIIRNSYPAKLLLIMVSRLIKLKQHHVVFPVIKDLINEGIDIKLLVLDEGPEENNLKTWVEENGMCNHIHMLGFRKDFINYMAAADILVQPSLTDASNSVAKEMALLEKIVAVSENVGDYSDYINDGVNGFLLPLKHPEIKLRNIILKVYENKNLYEEFGYKLKKRIIEKFDINYSKELLKDYTYLMK